MLRTKTKSSIHLQEAALDGSKVVAFSKCLVCNNPLVQSVATIFCNIRAYDRRKCQDQMGRLAGRPLQALDIYIIVELTSVTIVDGKECGPFSILYFEQGCMGIFHT